MCNEKQQTVRQTIMDHLDNTPMTARDISGAVGITEKDVYHHLDFIEKSVRQKGKKLHVDPAYCRDCGFVFKDRKKLKKPGRCPVCRDGRIASAVFTIF